VIARLQTLSRRDSLTRLLNRRAFERALRHEAARARRFDEPLSLLLIDLDHFKRINDEHGHAAGDALLFAVSRTLKTVARDIDRVARFGGEEFCILLPRTTTAGAKQVAGRVCAAIAGTRVNRTEHALSVTASIGVATSRNKHEPVQRIIERADQSMYRAKAQGRNRFAVDGSDDGIVASRAPEFQRRKTPAKKTAREPTGSGACLSQLPKAHSRMPRNSRVAR
jgi:diguanylate cyclase (GGDEF)-like protein